VVLDGLHAVLLLFDDAAGFIRFSLELLAQRRDPGLERVPLAVQLSLPRLALLLQAEGGGSLLRLLGLPRGSGQDALGAEIDVRQLDPLAREEELADLVRVGHPT